jgi:hypothetical protein
MLLKNLDTAQGLVNGSRGTVIDFRDCDDISDSLFPQLPVVKFEVTIGKVKKEIERVMTQEEWTIEQGGKTLASRIQIPLKLAWAMSIHKSQGMTIPKLEVCGVFVSSLILVLRNFLFFFTHFPLWKSPSNSHFFTCEFSPLNPFRTHFQPTFNPLSTHFQPTFNPLLSYFELFSEYTRCPSRTCSSLAKATSRCREPFRLMVRFMVM